MSLDKIDVELLTLLQEDARRNYNELSVSVNKSIASVHGRIKKLKENGYIKSISILIDRKKMGLDLISFVEIFLKEKSSEDLINFENEVLLIPQVSSCFQICGTVDFLLRVQTSDMEDYGLFLKNILSVLPNIDRINSFFVLSEVKVGEVYQVLL